MLICPILRNKRQRRLVLFCAVDFIVIVFFRDLLCSIEQNVEKANKPSMPPVAQGVYAVNALIASKSPSSSFSVLYFF